MFGENKSKALNIDPIPLLGVYKNDEQIEFFITEQRRNEIDLEHLPHSLCSFLLDNEQNLPPQNKYTYMTIQSNIPIEIQPNNGYYRVNLFFHPYVFLDEGNNHNTFVNAAIFTPSNHISQFSIKPARDATHLKVNPSGMNSCSLEVNLHYENGCKKLSPDNSHFFIKEELPIHVIYSICIINFNNKPDRLLICKHVIVSDTGFPLYFPFSLKALGIDQESKIVVQKIISNLKETIDSRKIEPTSEFFGQIFGYFNRDVYKLTNLINELIPNKDPQNPRLKRYVTILNLYLDYDSLDSYTEYRNTQLYYIFRTLAQEVIEFLTDL